MTGSLPPMITARALGSMPQFIETQIGERALDRVMQRSGLPYLILEHRDLFIPESLLVSFLDNSAREAGDDKLGLLIAPHLTVADYDVWGEYVLGAATLRESLVRAVDVIGLHSNDKVAMSCGSGDMMKFTYDFGMRSEIGYDHIAVCAVGVICSIFRFYRGAAWRPAAIDLDISKPQHSAAFEDVFGCPVRFGKGVIAVWFAAEQLSSTRPDSAQTSVTVFDIARKRFGGTPRSATDKALGLVMLQLLDGAPDLEDAAERIRIGTRTLQRALASEGTTFREIANAAVAKRSRELLSDSRFSITEIAGELGYSSPAHFARAFRKQTGQSPSTYRALVTGVSSRDLVSA